MILSTWDQIGLPSKGEGVDFIGNKELVTRTCTENDFRDKFYGIHSSFVADKDYTKKMKCTDEEYNIWGDYNTGSSSNLKVVFDLCDPKKRKCKSQAEIDKWLFGKYLVVLQN